MAFPELSKLESLADRVMVQWAVLSYDCHSEPGLSARNPLLAGETADSLRLRSGQALRARRPFGMTMH